MKSNKYTVIKGGLTTITPVSIGTSQEAVRSPYTDFVVSKDNQNVHYIDHTLFEQELLKQGDQIIHDFARAIAQMDNNRSNFNLFQFINQRLNVPLEKVVSTSLPSKGLTYQDRIMITEVIKTAGKVYIPGSTMKGAIRNAMLYDWLTKDKEYGGKEKLKEWTEQIDTCYKTSQNMISELEGLMKEQKRTRLNRDKFSKLRYLKRKLQEQIRKHIEMDDSYLFGNMRDKRRKTALDSHHIRIGDTEAQEASDHNLGVYFTQRLNLGTGKLTVPQVKEAILPDVSFPFQWEILKGFTHPYLKYWDKHAPSDLLRVLNNFSLASIDYESTQTDELLDRKSIRELQAFKEAYQELIRQSNNLDEKNEAIFRIGSGKTYYDNSYGLALRKEDPEIHKKFRKLFMLEPLQDIYPITRTVSVINQEVKSPLGWVKVILLS